LLSLAFFLAWLWITLFAPAYDAQRARQLVTMADGRVLSVDYPMRFLIQEVPSEVYFTVNTTQPISIVLGLPTNLHLVIREVEPKEAVQIDNLANDRIVITWPISVSVAALSSPTQTNSASAPISASTTIPVIGHSSTVSLRMSNAQTESGWNTHLLFSSFIKASLTIPDAAKNGVIQTEVETTGRANWRLFAEKYSFLAIVPFLIAGLSTLSKLYVDRQKEQQRLAATEQERLRASISKGNPDFSAERQLNNLRRYRPQIAQDDWNSIEKLVSLHDGKIDQVKDRIRPDDFTRWSDAWAGALAAATERVFADAPDMSGKVAKNQQATEKKQERQTPESDTAAKTQQVTEKKQERKTFEINTPKDATSNPSSVTDPERDMLRIWLRVFPRDLLSAAAEKCIQDGARKAQLSNLQEQAWPMPPQPPKGYNKGHKRYLALKEMCLFPNLDATTESDQSYLFSSDTSWFWREHSLYKEVSKHGGNVVVSGDAGVGRSALALALSRFADHSLYILPSYHVGLASIENVQVALAHQLLAYSRWRTTRLTQLDQEERELLAKLMLAVLDAQYVLAKLGASEPRQYDDAENEGQKSVWREQATIEMRLLRQSIKRAEQLAVPVDQWFLGLSHVAERLKFKRILVALDMTANEWSVWSVEHMAKFLDISRKQTLVLPFRFVVMVDGKGTSVSSSAEVAAMNYEWDANDLLEMLKHRMLQRGISEDEIIHQIDDSTADHLASTAKNNPQNLARVWQAIERNHPLETKITQTMIARGSTE